MKGNPISTLTPCYSFHIGEVIQIWLARLMWSLRNISHTVIESTTKVCFPTSDEFALLSGPYWLFNSVGIWLFFMLVLLMLLQKED